MYHTQVCTIYLIYNLKPFKDFVYFISMRKIIDDKSVNPNF